MKAILQARYGPPDVLTLEDVANPAPPDGQVLVRVHASSINALDWHRLRGEPLVVRMSDGIRRPRDPRLGTDVAGIVNAIGPGVTELKVGDQVFGVAAGAFAEFAAARPTNVVPMPGGVSFQHAAAVPVAATTALQGVRDHGRVQRGQEVLIHGAGGGVGTFAVQIARSLGARVTAVSGTRNLEALRSLGADEVVDSSREDFTNRSGRYDLIVDIAGTRSVSQTRRALKPDGTYVLIGAPSGRWLRPMDRFLEVLVRSRFGRQRLVGFMARIRREDLLVLRSMLEDGSIRPVIDRTYPLRETPDAIRAVEARQVTGKVAIAVAGDSVAPVGA
jgi:NADPH:quinone reductase-like Zn-dependent oxidoreductase